MKFQIIYVFLLYILITANTGFSQRIPIPTTTRNADCLGIEGGSAIIDECGICAGDSSSCFDCASVPNGKAKLDSCNDCCGGTTNLKCDRNRDKCGVCYGLDESCSDCSGEAYGDAKLDCSGVCQGTDMSCYDCKGVMDGPAILDICQICEGDGTSCDDCEGTPNGGKIKDICGVCDGNGLSCLDCKSIPNGPNLMDRCGVCGGDSRSCCTGEQSEFIKTNLCNDHGDCSGRYQHCLCHPGWTGPFCDAPQNMCQPWEDCSGRGTCNQNTGACQCQPGFMGVQCEYSTCGGGHGVYDLSTEKCKCTTGYEGETCEKCAADVFFTTKKVKNSITKGGHSFIKQANVRLCMLVAGETQEIPVGAESVKQATPVEAMMIKTGAAENLKQLRDGDRAPIFVSVTVIGIKEAISWLSGASHSVDANGISIVIKPMSLHNATGFWYDCACRLAVVNQTAVSRSPLMAALPAPVIIPDDDATPDDDGTKWDIDDDEPTNKKKKITNGEVTEILDTYFDKLEHTLHGAAETMGNDAHTLSDAEVEALQAANATPDSGSIIASKNVVVVKHTYSAKNDIMYRDQPSQVAWKKSRREDRERFTASLRAPATLGEFQSLTQAIMDQWVILIDTTTATSTVIADALDKIIGGLQFNASFALLFAIGMWTVFSLLMILIPALAYMVWTMYAKKDGFTKNI